MKWFNRKDKNINTPTSQKKELPDGMWYKTPGGSIVHIRELKNNSYVCPEDDYHVRIGSKEYFEILFDNKSFKEYDADILSEDPLKFTDTKSYKDRVKKTIKATGLNDAIRTAQGKVNGHKLIISCMDFSFIGGSMGSVVGEKISRAIDISLKKKIPLMIISKSGGARMMESTYSLMQMAKTSAKLSLLDKNKIPYISLMTDPTTGGVSASFAMLGDFNIAEPGALIGFAGPRVIKETIGSNLPKGFQKSEFLIEHGFIDFIVDRRDLKTKISKLLALLKN
ncbi:MAG: acetyl-CoA carboxylase, carboxyltransferase subunit beta [Bacteroidota bacterium]|jgi:acetyl-CoA carboxylase carboxyl transferase subunit beta|nr:acetyl-CoA carboxylase carboxyl transferase subunit beta [Flammeovirgaceae bacterium]MEC8222135.1 acetyl-CoA carboxylase, carboxyltransferase subunit beta [Bacteroidota bacterium]|tara:strand:- start:2706 stop:3548 length:843 start_codon:yes stop_codon:yes gene_type:complete